MLVCCRSHRTTAREWGSLSCKRQGFDHRQTCVQEAVSFAVFGLLHKAGRRGAQAMIKAGVKSLMELSVELIFSHLSPAKPFNSPPAAYAFLCCSLSSYITRSFSVTPFTAVVLLPPPVHLQSLPAKQRSLLFSLHLLLCWWFSSFLPFPLPSVFLSSFLPSFLFLLIFFFAYSFFLLSTISSFLFHIIFLCPSFYSVFLQSLSFFLASFLLSLLSSFLYFCPSFLPSLQSLSFSFSFFLSFFLSFLPSHSHFLFIFLSSFNHSCLPASTVTAQPDHICSCHGPHHVIFFFFF